MHLFTIVIPKAGLLDLILEHQKSFCAVAHIYRLPSSFCCRIFLIVTGACAAKAVCRAARLVVINTR